MTPPTFDQRGAMICATFVAGIWFASLILWMVAVNPALLQDSAFIGLATAILAATLGSGGVGLILTWAFGGSKTGGETSAKLADSVVLNPGANPVPDAVIPPVAPADKVD